MKRLLIILFLSFLPLSAFAAEGESQRYKVSGLCYSNPTKSGCADDGDSFCSGAIAGVYEYMGGWSWSGTRIVCNIKDQSGNPSTTGIQAMCKEGTPDYSKFECYSTTKPKPESCPAAGTVASSMAETVITGAFSNKICEDGCEIQGTQYVECIDNGDGTKYCNLAPPFIYTGLKCSTGESGVGGGGEEGGGDGGEEGGQGSGENGNGEGGENGGESGTGGGEGEGGTKPGTGGGVGGGEDGDGDKPGGGTGGNGSGNGNGDGDGEEEGDDDSKWSGSCSGGFQGEGDALAVAIAQAEWERNCTFIHNPKESEEYKYYESSKGEYSNEKGSSWKDLEIDTIDLQNKIKTGDLLGSCSSLSDKTVSFRGRSYKLPLSLVNEHLHWIGLMVQAAAYLIALFIVFRT